MRRNKIGDRHVSRVEEFDVRTIGHDSLGRRLGSWLQAELDRDERLAEVELRQAFRMLATPAPAEDLVDATMARLGFVPRTRRAGFVALAFRLLVAMALAAAGLALAAAPWVVGPLLASVRLSWIVDWWTATVVGVSQRYAGGLVMWQVLRDIAETVAATLATPVSVAALVAAVLVSLMSLRALTELVSFERSAGNA